MWPIYFLLAYYAMIYLFLATAAYVCISVVAGQNELGKRLFVAILVFGGCALVGYVISGVVSYLQTGSKPIQGPNRLVIAIAYILPGTIGAWVSWRRFKPST
jgi:hypothetical protein